MTNYVEVYSFSQAQIGKGENMNKLIIAFLSVALLFNPAYAKEKAHSVSLPAGIQEAQAATLEDTDDNEKPKIKKKATKKAKKSKKAKRQ